MTEDVSILLYAQSSETDCLNHCDGTVPFFDKSKLAKKQTYKRKTAQTLFTLKQEKAQPTSLT